MREMKDSGFSWLGKVPHDWKILKVKDGFVQKKEKAHQSDPVVLSLARSGVKVRDMTSAEGQFATSYYDYNPVSVDDLMLNPMDLVSGDNCSISEVEGVISPAYVNLRYKIGYNPKFYHYYFKYQYWSMAFFSYGKGVSFENRWTLNSETLMKYPLLSPDYDEQCRIASFLDAKCTEIDALSADIQSEIDTLEAYKRSVITEAVTKGLDKNAEMKEVNNTWIKEIPCNWELLKTGYLFVERSVRATGDEIPLSLSQKDGLVKTDDMVEHSMKSKTYDGWKKVWVNDLVLNRFKAHLGVFFCSKYMGMVSFHYGVYIPKVKLNVKYYEYLYHSKPYCDMFAELSNGITVGLQNLGNATFYSAKSIFPPLEVQNKIVEYLDYTLGEVDITIEKKQEQLEVLADYKKSIIYEYVTGKKEVPV